MGSFASGFQTGLFNSLADGMEKRRDDADAYFNEQMARAREIGVKVRGQAQELASAGVQTAQQLQQMGVPKTIIMAIANQNPEQLGEFYNQVADASAKGVPLNEEFFNDFVTVSEGFKASDEDWSSFFGRVYEPLAANVKADPEGFQRDRKGGILSTFMGYNAMEGANRRLATTEVEGGMTADELLAYGDRVTPRRPLGDNTVTFNYGAIREALPQDGRSREIFSPSEITGIRDQIKEAETEALNGMQISENGATPEQRAEAARIAVESIAKVYGTTPEAQAEVYRIAGMTDPNNPRVPDDTITVSPIPETAPTEAAPTSEEVGEALNRPVEATGEATEALPTNPATPTAQTATSATAPVTGLPRVISPLPGDEGEKAPIDVRSETDLIEVQMDPNNPASVYVFEENLGNGKAIYKTPSGKFIEVDIATLRKEVRGQ